VFTLWWRRVASRGEAERPVEPLDGSRLAVRIDVLAVEVRGDGDRAVSHLVSHQPKVRAALKQHHGERVPERGTIFDRVWIDGNPGNQFRGMQTILLGSSNSVAVEFVIPENGSYIMVDHHFANASQGAMGLISTAARADGTEIEHHNLPASATPTELEAAQGKLNFESKCVACHSHGGSEPPTECWRAIPMLRRCSQGVQQPADAQPESLPRGDPAIHPVLQMGRRSAPRFAVLERSRPLTPRPTVRVASPRVRVAEVGRRARVSRPISHLPVLAAATGAWGLCRVS
jgi:hypothetical protein